MTAEADGKLHPTTSSVSDDRHSTPCLWDMDSSSQHLLRSESISLAHGEGAGLFLLIFNIDLGQMSPKFNHFM